MSQESRFAGAKTIYALSTAPGRAGVAIIRVSGGRSKQALEQLAAGVTPIPRMAHRMRFREPLSGELLDDGLAIWFPGPASFTGEDVVELHVHGGHAVVASILAGLSSMAGLRLAEPGEFSRRAFENGKLDLTQVEGLADLIDAETDGQRRLALGHSTGVLRRMAEEWRKRIVEIQGLTEAAIDFSDEEDVASDALQRARKLATGLVLELGQHLSDGNRGEILRDGFRVAIMGPPNAGKSSLINMLAGRDAVIVSQEAGTTRDVIELHLNLDGLRVLIADTAGVRDHTGPIEKEGIRRGLAWARDANLVLWLEDGTEEAPSNVPMELRKNPEKYLLVRTKVDLRRVLDEGPSAHKISSVTGEGINSLVDAISKLAQGATSAQGEIPLISQARHRETISSARDALDRFSLRGDMLIELAAEDARSAAYSIGRLTGRIGVEEILGEIFSRFCIGK